MDKVARKLNSISAGRVLDVGTGQGGSIKTLIEHLKDFESATGVDIQEKHINKARELFVDDPRICFEVMSADDLRFPDASFDTVNITVSLHHLSNVDKSLSEMKRVLKPTGTFIIFEMHRDSPTPRQLTQILWHHLGAEMDTMLGTSHHATYERDELIQLIENAGFSINEMLEPEPEEKNKEELDTFAAALDMRIEMLNGRPELESLRKRVDDVKERIYTVGIQSPPALVMFCSKRNDTKPSH